MTIQINTPEIVPEEVLAIANAFVFPEAKQGDILTLEGVEMSYTGTQWVLIQGITT